MTQQLSGRAVKRIQKELLAFHTVNEVVKDMSKEQDDRRSMLLAKKFGKKKSTKPHVEEKMQIGSNDSKKDKTIFLHVPNESDMSRILAMIIGPESTPFAGAFLCFEIRFPYNYPIDPPTFKFITPNTPDCRMHPNLYACGKVCLSILNTWAEKQWSAYSTIENVLTTIQSILTSNPITHEPAHEGMPSDDGRAIIYECVSRYRALSAGLVFFMTRHDVPAEFHEAAMAYINKHTSLYHTIIRTLHIDIASISEFGKWNIPLDITHCHDFILTHAKYQQLEAGITALLVKK